MDNRSLTIVLTLWDRAPFTYRWMRYMDDMRCPYPILVADGGAEPGVEAHLRRPEHYPHLNYTYIRYPFDQDYRMFLLKFADAVGRVATPYVLLADNDDFFLLEHIPTFLRFLDEDESFVSCGGHRVRLRLLSADGTLVAAPVAEQYAATAADRPTSVTHVAGVDRVCHFMANLEPAALWASWDQVHRTPAVQQAAALARRHAFGDPVAFELHVHIWLLLTGKYQDFDVPFLVRQLGTSQVTATLNAGANMVERFLMTGVFGDLQASLESFRPRPTAADRERVSKAIAQWFAQQAIALYVPAGSPAPGGGPLARLDRLAPRVMRRLGAALGRRRPAPPALRLPLLEKYILASEGADE